MSDNNKKILMMSNTSWSVFNFRKNLINKLIAEGYSITVLAPEDEFSKELISLGVRFVNIKINNKGINPFEDAVLIIKIYNKFREIKPDIILNYTIKPVIYGGFAARVCNLKCISVITGLGYAFINYGLLTKIIEMMYKISHKKVKRVIFLNNDDKRLFITKGLIRDSAAYLIRGEGVDTSEFKPKLIKPDDERIKFLFIGRVMLDKGVAEYVEAAKYLCAKYKNVGFNILGFLDVKNKSAISREQIEKWERLGYIRYLGSTSDVKNFIEHNDVIVLPSYREGLSRSLMEASSMGKPVIASNITGCRELIEHGVTGLLCEPKNIKSLIDQMLIMINATSEHRQSMGTSGRRKMEAEFSDSVINSQFSKLIKFELSAGQHS